MVDASWRLPSDAVISLHYYVYLLLYFFDQVVSLSPYNAMIQYIIEYWIMLYFMLYFMYYDTDW